MGTDSDTLNKLYTDPNKTTIKGMVKRTYKYWFINRFKKQTNKNSVTKSLRQ